MIFRVTWTNECSQSPQNIDWFCIAKNQEEALRQAKFTQSACRDAEAREWSHCLAPQHAQIPSVPNLDSHSRQTEPAVMVYQGIPYCARCIEHKCSNLSTRVERLERALCELLDDFDIHTEDEA